jgi:4-amino-4-deoxy-L-arabinose transferase-like glycosyltransferase
VLLIAALAGLAYAWQLGRDPLEPYYAAAVRSMAGSWHDFIFGAFDPAGTVTLDKLPGAFWLQALSVRAFGDSTWAMVLPQVIEGILTVLVLYRAVARLAGPAAGLIAAFVLAASPAVVALDRGNISDSLMILLLVLAADAVSGAIVRGGQWWRLIGGFTGTIPAPTLSQLQADVRAGQFHLVLAFSTTDPRIAWVAAHCQAIPGATLQSYFCTPADAGR